VRLKPYLGLIAVVVVTSCGTASRPGAPANNSNSTDGTPGVTTGGPVSARSGPSGPTSAPISGTVPAPSAAAASPTCTLPDLRSALGPEATLPTRPLHQIVQPSGGVDTFAVTSDAIYVLGGRGLSIYALDGKLRHSFALPSTFTKYGDNGVSQPVVSPDGSIYLSSYYGQVAAAFSSTGKSLWTVHPDNPLNTFAITSQAGAFELAVSTTADSRASEVYSASGQKVGTTNLVAALGTTVSTGRHRDLLYSHAGYVQTWSGDGRKLLSTFGSGATAGRGEHTGGPYGFYYPGQAAQAGNGTIYNADPLDTLTVTSADGQLQGATTLGGALSMEPTGGMYLIGDDLYLSAGPAFSTNSAIDEVSLATVDRYLDAPQAPLDTLGWGAGLTTTRTANYFPPGSAPVVQAEFAGWWAPQAARLELRYSVWNARSLAAEQVPALQTVHLPTSAGALAHFDLPLPTADRTPGPYEVRAELWDASGSTPMLVRTTCLPYTVGATGDRLDLATLPSGLGGGGPTDPRGVALNAQLGLDGLRGMSIDWSDFLPDCNASSPTAATCGPSAMRFAKAPRSYFEAAALAVEHHVRYWVQVTGGDPTSLALVNGGWWQGDIRSLVGYYARVPANCGNCHAVTGWEPWNEANNTGWSDSAAYVTKVLQPFYRGVKAADPSATVIGGSSIGVDIGWWQGLIAAGGLADMDVASVHPYTGNNDSWEEDNDPGQVQTLQHMLRSTPLWFTEVGWWNDGDYNFLHQADAVASAMIWQKALRIPVWNYFFDEGNFGNDGVSFSLIQTGDDGDDYVKPAALATMEAATQTAGRTFTSMASTGIPQTYAARFAGHGRRLPMVALWSDELATTADVRVSSPSGGTVPVTLTSEYGASTTTRMASGKAYGLGMSAQLVYLSYPAGDTVTVGPAEPYGDDLALASSGASASASSGNPSAVIQPLSATTGEGMGWSSRAGDSDPALTVRLGRTTTINRIVVDTQSAGSTATGLRDYLVSVETPSGSWVDVDRVTGEFRDHQELITFRPRPARAVRIEVSVVNFGGYYGGGIPPFWSPTDPGLAFVHSVEVYAGGDAPATADGDGLPRLPAPT
jgi:hypothetical protein